MNSRLSATSSPSQASNRNTKTPLKSRADNEKGAKTQRIESQPQKRKTPEISVPIYKASVQQELPDHLHQHHNSSEKPDTKGPKETNSKIKQIQILDIEDEFRADPQIENDDAEDIEPKFPQWWNQVMFYVSCSIVIAVVTIFIIFICIGITLFGGIMIHSAARTKFFVRPFDFSKRDDHMFVVNTGVGILNSNPRGAFEITSRQDSDSDSMRIAYAGSSENSDISIKISFGFNNQANTLETYRLHPSNYVEYMALKAVTGYRLVKSSESTSKIAQQEGQADGQLYNPNYLYVTGDLIFTDTTEIYNNFVTTGYIRVPGTQDFFMSHEADGNFSLVVGDKTIFDVTSNAELSFYGIMGCTQDSSVSGLISSTDLQVFHSMNVSSKLADSIFRIEGRTNASLILANGYQLENGETVQYLIGMDGTYIFMQDKTQDVQFLQLDTIGNMKIKVRNTLQFNSESTLFEAFQANEFRVNAAESNPAMFEFASPANSTASSFQMQVIDNLFAFNFGNLTNALLFNATYVSNSTTEEIMNTAINMNNVTFQNTQGDSVFSMISNGNTSVHIMAKEQQPSPPGGTDYARLFIGDTTLEAAATSNANSTLSMHSNGTNVMTLTGIDNVKFNLSEMTVLQRYQPVKASVVSILKAASVDMTGTDQHNTSIRVKLSSLTDFYMDISSESEFVLRTSTESPILTTSGTNVTFHKNMQLILQNSFITSNLADFTSGTQVLAMNKLLFGTFSLYRDSFFSSPQVSYVDLLRGQNLITSGSWRSVQELYATTQTTFLGNVKMNMSSIVFTEGDNRIDIKYVGNETVSIGSTLKIMGSLSVGEDFSVPAPMIINGTNGLILPNEYRKASGSVTAQNGSALSIESHKNKMYRSDDTLVMSGSVTMPNLEVNGDIYVTGSLSGSLVSLSTFSVVYADRVPGRNLGRFASAVRLPNSRSFIAYFDDLSRSLRVCLCIDLSCTRRSIHEVDHPDDDPGSYVGKFASMAVTSTRETIIVYASLLKDPMKSGLKVAVCGDVLCSFFVSTTLIEVGISAMFTSVAIGIDGNPLISYFDAQKTELHIAHCRDPRCVTGADIILADKGTKDVGRFSSLIIGVDGLGFVAYYDEENQNLRAVHCADVRCSTVDAPWVIDGFSSQAGTFVSVALGIDGLPIISYYEDSFALLKVAHCENVRCTVATLSYPDVNSQGSGQYSNIMIGEDGLPVISYYDSMRRALKVAHCSNVACTGKATIAIVDGPSTNGGSYVGEYNTMITANDFKPFIAYYDATVQALKAAHCSNVFCIPNVKM